MQSILMEKAKLESQDNLKKKGWCLIVYERISPLYFLKIKKAEKDV